MLAAAERVVGWCKDWTNEEEEEVHCLSVCK